MHRLQCPCKGVPYGGIDLGGSAKGGCGMFIMAPAARVRVAPRGLRPRRAEPRGSVENEEIIKIPNATNDY